MAGRLLHEELYRGGADVLAELRDVQVVLCGAGAVGSNLADNLARQGFAKLRVIDHDRIEEHNVGTQLYGESEVGVWKVEALRNRLFRATGVEIEAVRTLGVPCLHVGLFEDYCEVLWDEGYRVPRDVAGDVCEYPLARNGVLLAVAIASETLMAFCLEGRRAQWSATLKDFAVRPVESAP